MSYNRKPPTGSPGLSSSETSFRSSSSNDEELDQEFHSDGESDSREISQSSINVSGASSSSLGLRDGSKASGYTPSPRKPIRKSPRSTGTPKSPQTPQDEHAPIYPNLKDFYGADPGAETSPRAGAVDRTPAKASHGSPVRKRRDTPSKLPYDTRVKAPPSTSQDTTHTPQTLCHTVCVARKLCAGLIVFIALSVIACGGYHMVSSTKPEAEVPQWQANLQQFTSGIEDLKKEFPSQNERVWTTLSASTRRIIAEANPNQPAVILMASSVADTMVADCLARKFINMVSGVLNATEKLFINVTLLSPPDAKRVLDAKLQRLGEGAFGAVLYSLEHMDGDTGMLLHGYCDNDNAQFKRAVLVFTLHLDNIKPVELDLPEESLEKIWMKTLSPDDVAALLSRVANNPVIVKAEEDHAMHASVCL